jgi:hypothetical protein
MYTWQIVSKCVYIHIDPGTLKSAIRCLESQHTRTTFMQLFMFTHLQCRHDPPCLHHVAHLQNWVILLPSVYILFTVHVNCIFHLNPSSHNVALRLTHSLTEMSTKDISWGSKGGWCVGLTTLLPLCADCLEILGSSTSLNPRGLPDL